MNAHPSRSSYTNDLCSCVPILFLMRLRISNMSGLTGERRVRGGLRRGSVGHSHGSQECI